MQATQLSMKPLADHSPVPNEHGPYKWIGTDAPPPTLGKLQSTPQMSKIRDCELPIHATD
jgi:hypothetical protein